MKYMKYRVFSDIHLDHSKWEVPALKTDKDTVLIVAGDLGHGAMLDVTAQWLDTQGANFREVIVVLGNHDYWASDKPLETPAQLRALVTRKNIHILEKDIVEIDGLKIGGATLWTDIAKEDPLRVMNAKRYTNDFRYMNNFSVENWLEQHRETVAWIDANPMDILVTHFVPWSRFTHSIYANEVANCMFSSDVITKLKVTPKVWIFGHTHHSYKEYVNDTLFICNPRGYSSYENRDFDNKSLFELEGI